MRHPFITALLLRQAPPPLPSCQPAVGDQAQARVNQEGVAPTGRGDTGRGYPRTKGAPCRDSPEDSCGAPRWC
jgi:hypothetical protein